MCDSLENLDLGLGYPFWGQCYGAASKRLPRSAASQVISCSVARTPEEKGVIVGTILQISVCQIARQGVHENCNTEKVERRKDVNWNKHISQGSWKAL